MRLCLDGAWFGNAVQVHNYLANQLQLPAWYGRNLDALYDCLTDRSEETELVLVNWPAEGALQRFLPVLRDAAQENPRLHITEE